MEAREILEKLGIQEELVVNIYPYGSRVYGTAEESSDEDYIIVFKSAFLPNGAFRNNAISSEDRTVQAVCYSRTGFQDALNNYEIGALECYFLPEEKVVQRKWPFRMSKWDTKDMVKSIISKASASWYLATVQYRDEEEEMSRKGIYHALRILDFGLQMKEYGRIVDYGTAVDLKRRIQADSAFKPKNWINVRNSIISTLKNERRKESVDRV